MRRDFSLPLGSADKHDQLHRYIADLAAVYADHLDFGIKAFHYKEPEFEETIAKGDCSVTITRCIWGRPPTQGYGCRIFVWLAEESLPKDPVTVLVGETPGIDLPSLKWLQSPLPTMAAPIARSGESAGTA